MNEPTRDEQRNWIGPLDPPLPGVGDFDPAFYLKNAQSVLGWPCAPLEFIVDWKLGVARDKDLHDVLAIREYLGTSVSATDGG